MRLTVNQRATLLHMLLHNGISYSDEWDRTMLSLKRHGLVSPSRGGKYGKSCWHLTDAGTEKVKPNA